MQLVATPPQTSSSIGARQASRPAAVVVLEAAATSPTFYPSSPTIDATPTCLGLPSAYVKPVICLLSATLATLVGGIVPWFVRILSEALW